MKKLIYTPIFLVLFILSCVEPPDYSDGLLENKPAVINESDYFSLSLLGDKYTEIEEWDLFINSNLTETLLTTLVIKDLNNSSTDSSFLLLINEFGDTVMNVRVLDELVFSSNDSIIHIGIPSKVVLQGENFTGRIEYQIMLKTN